MSSTGSIEEEESEFLRIRNLNFGTLPLTCNEVIVDHHGLFMKVSLCVFDLPMDPKEVIIFLEEIEECIFFRPPEYKTGCPILLIRLKDGPARVTKWKWMSDIPFNLQSKLCMNPDSDDVRKRYISFVIEVDVHDIQNFARVSNALLKLRPKRMPEDPKNPVVAFVRGRDKLLSEAGSLNEESLMIEWKLKTGIPIEKLM